MSGNMLDTTLDNTLDVITIVTHKHHFSASEVYAAALLSIAHESCTVRVLRVNHQSFNLKKFVPTSKTYYINIRRDYEPGRIYDSTLPGFNEYYPPLNPEDTFFVPKCKLSACGLVWREHGASIAEELGVIDIPNFVQTVYNDFFKEIDAVQQPKPTASTAFMPRISLANCIEYMNWGNDGDNITGTDDIFKTAVESARTLISAYLAYTATNHNTYTNNYDTLVEAFDTRRHEEILKLHKGANDVESFLRLYDPEGAVKLAIVWVNSKYWTFQFNSIPLYDPHTSSKITCFTTQSYEDIYAVALFSLKRYHSLWNIFSNTYSFYVPHGVFSA